MAVVLDKKALYGKILDAISASGWNVSIINDLESHPLKLSVSFNNDYYNLLIYVWNITHGGKTRSEDEFRIQITGVKKLDFIEGYKTLLLGIADVDGQDVFVAFNPFKHNVFGASPSIQVNKTALDSALQNGVAFQEKSRSPKGMVNEIVITLSPNQFIQYVSTIYDEYHNSADKEIEKSEAELILKNPLDREIPFSLIEKLPAERKKAISKINRAIRDRIFQMGVYSLYEGRCCICGLQANLTEAAHIIAVKNKGTDEWANGLLLCANHHKAYDKGLLAVDENYIIKLNKKYISELKRIKLDGKLDEFVKDCREGQKITLPKEANFNPSKEYLKKNIQSKGIQFFL